MHCSFAENHPAQVILFTGGGLLAAGLAGAAIGNITLGGAITTGTSVTSTAESINMYCGGDCSDEFGQLSNVAKNTWQSTQGLIYGPKPNGSNAVLHVLDHMQDIPTKNSQGVFTIDRAQVLPLIDKAWVDIQNMNPSVVAYESSTINNATGYVVDMGQTIGYVGGITGATLGYPSTNLLNLVLNGTTVITAFPIALP